MLTKEQIDALPGLVARFDCHGWDIRRGIMRQADDGAWVEYDDYATLAATVIEQQAEIDRLRELLGTVFSRHRAQIDEPLYTDIVMEIDQ